MTMKQMTMARPAIIVLRKPNRSLIYPAIRRPRSWPISVAWSASAGGSEELRRPIPAEAYLLKPFLDLILCQGSYSVSRGPCCIKGLMLYQGAHAVSTVSQLARGSDEYRNGLGIKGTLESASIRFRYTDIKIYEPILSATINMHRHVALIV